MECQSLSLVIISYFKFNLFSVSPILKKCFFSVCTIGESVFARCLSSLQAERVEASSHLKGPATSKYTGDKKEFIEHIRKVK